MTVSVFLKPVTRANWKACCELEVAQDQAGFLPSNLHSLAEAQFYPEAVSQAIYNAQGALVGFVLYGIDEVTGLWKVFRLMVDRAHQRHGYGRAAMECVIEQLRAKPDCDRILIAYHETNTAARRLYAGLGFVEKRADNGITTAELDLLHPRQKSLERPRKEPE